MPVYDFSCEKCGVMKEVITPQGGAEPECCGVPMKREWTVGILRIKNGYPLWVDKIDEIHKAQADKGERLRLPHPKEVGAT